MQTPGPQRPLSSNALFGAAFSAPGLAASAFILGAVATPLVSNGLGSALFNLIFLAFIATVWGFIPSLAFGGLVLAVIQRIRWRKRPTALVFMFGGAVAAGLYVLTGLGIAGLSPGVAMFFAPWATPDLWGPGADGKDWWLVASLLLAGAGAGLIYSAFVKRG